VIGRDEIPKVVSDARNLIADAEHHTIGALARDYQGKTICWWDDEAEMFCIVGALRRALWEHAGCPMLRDDNWWYDVHEDSEIAMDTDRILARIRLITGHAPSLPTINDKQGRLAVLAILDQYLRAVERVTA
jgi:hypothetical protein